MRQKKYVGQEWAGRDLTLVSIFVGLVAASAYDIAFLYAAVAYAAAVATYFVVRTVERRRAEDANTSPSWTERLKDD